MALPTESAKQQINQVIDRGERLIWAGEPDAEAMQQGTGHGGHRTAWFFLIVGTIAFIGIGLTAYSGNEAFVVGLPESFEWPVILIAALVPFTLLRRFLHNRSDVYDWAKGLTYGITDKRLLILSEGHIEHEYVISEVNQPTLIPRRNTPGFSDVVWGQTVAERTARHGSISAKKQEEMRVGFKALADGEMVLRKIEDWRDMHLQRSAEETQSFIERHDDGELNHRNIRNPTHDFSIEVPDSWGFQVRYRKLAFGKWGIEREAQWGAQETIPTWNVLRVDSVIGSYVELQVQTTKPVNTLDGMLNSPAAAAVGLTKVIDQDADFEVGGIQGFYLTRERDGKANTVQTGQVVDVSTWHMRQYILYDGQRQYYFEAVWPEDSDSERAICLAIVATFKAR